MERACGVPVKQFQIPDRPIQMWNWDEIIDLLDCCVILHNLIVEHRRTQYSVSSYKCVGRIDVNVPVEDPPFISLFDVNEIPP